MNRFDKDDTFVFPYSLTLINIDYFIDTETLTVYSALQFQLFRGSNKYLEILRKANKEHLRIIKLALEHLSTYKQFEFNELEIKLTLEGKLGEQVKRNYERRTK